MIGGTGPEGRGLALRFARAGERVLIGSRDAGRAAEAAEALSLTLPEADIAGAANQDVARDADIVFVTLPYEGHRSTLESVANDLRGKIVVDVVAPLSFNKGQASAISVEEGSAAMQAQAILPDSKVVGAFQSISAQDLLDPDKPIDSDAVICADDANAKEIVMRLAQQIEGVRAVDGGRLENACYVESFTALLLNINRIYKAHSTIKIGGI
jgi:NADPH-dependent F420 reductase